jgi:hypothetical protein
VEKVNKENDNFKKEGRNPEVNVREKENEKKERL